MKSKRQLGWVLAALVLLALGAGNLFAQSGEDSGIPTNIGYPSNPPGPNNPGAPPNAGIPSNDPPARVARIQYISGEVSLQPGGVNDWVAANLNRPLTTSDRVWTDKNSKVELNVGNAFLRMDSESSLTFTNVGDNTIQAELDQGVIELTVQHLEPGEIFEIDTPNLAFTVMKSGVYVITVRPSDDQTWVTVRKGNGQATGNGPAVKVNSGDQVRFTGQNSLQHEAYAAPAPDGFEDWAQVRDKRLDGSQSARYVAPGTIGYQDLDYYGRWQVVPNYGAIWVPTSVPAGWAPYRYGHWVWIAPWGWTWVDDAPWGFAPFHYGRWVSYGGHWGWAPGPAYVGWRPYYAPALVGWVGGAGWGFGISFGVGFGIGGGCGWFPLGWGEPYYPWYHGYRGGYVSQNYIRNVNVTNTHITNITNVSNNYYHNSINNTHYVNRTVAGAVTAAPKSALANGQNIAKVGMPVPKSELGRGEVMRSVDVTPAKAAMLGGHTATPSAAPPRAAFGRQVVTSATPPSRTASQNIEAHNVPQSPASLGVHNPTSGTTPGTTHNVPRPPERNTAVTTPPAGSYNPQTGSHSVPKPPYAGSPAPHTNTTADQHNTSASPSPYGHGAPAQQQPSHTSQPPASSNHGSQSGNSKENKQKEATPPKSGSGMASANVPRPPASYGYHAAPAYSASSYAAGSSAHQGTAQSYGPPASPYASGPSSYRNQGSSYRTGGGYGSAPTYTTRSNTPPAATPHYAAPSASRNYGGGGGGGHYSNSGSSASSSSAGHGSGHSH